MLILFTIVSFSNSDTLSESEYNSGQDSISEIDKDSDKTLEPEYNIYKEFEDSSWNPSTQLYATQSNQLYTSQLAQLHADIKARAELPDPLYPKLPRYWPVRLFDIRTLPDHIRSPIYYFELFWTPEIWDLLVQNTNTYARFKEAQNKGR